MRVSKVSKGSEYLGRTDWVVRIDGKPYAIFTKHSNAVNAVRLWLGEIDGSGNHVPESERKGPVWRALAGRSIDIVPR